MIEQILNGEALSSIRTKLNEVINLVNTPVLESLPSVDASKAGRKFWLNDTLWTYAKEGQFGSLAVGTPWPVKGYKELYIRFTQTGTNPPVAVSTIINEIGEFTLGRTGVGRYNIVINGAFPSGKVITNVPKSIATGANGLAGRFISSTRLNNDTINLNCNKIEAPAAPEAIEFIDTFDLYIRVQG